MMHQSKVEKFLGDSVQEGSPSGPSYCRLAGPSAYCLPRYKPANGLEIGLVLYQKSEMKTVSHT